MQLTSFPEPSVTVHVTSVVPRLNTWLLRLVPVPVVAPESAYAIDATVQLSLAVAFHAVPECV